MKLQPLVLVSLVLSCLLQQAVTSLVVHDSHTDVTGNYPHAENKGEHTGSQQHHRSADRKSQRLRASARAKHVSKVRPEAAPVATIASLRHELAEEKALRLKENGLAKKLTAVLSRTTKALKVKGKCSKDAEKKQIEKLQQASESERTARQTAEAKVDQLTKVFNTAKEKNEKLTVEVADLTTQLASARLEHRDSGADLKNLQSELERLRNENKKLTSASEQGKKDLDALRDHVDEAEAARRSKTEELAKKVLQAEGLKKKEKDDLAELEHKGNETMKSMMLRFDESLASQKKEAETSLAKLNKNAESLTEANKKLLLKIQQEESQMEQGKKNLQSADQKIHSQQTALDSAQMEIKKQKIELVKDEADMKNLKTKADMMSKAQQQVEELTLANSALNQTNAERNSALEAALAKVHAEGEELRVTHEKLQDATVKLAQSSQAETKDAMRVQELQEALRQVQADAQMHEEDLKAQKQLLESSTEEKIVLTKELDETQAKLAELERREKEIAGVHEQLSQIQSLLKKKEQDLHSMQQKLQQFVDKDQEWAETKDKMKELVAEQKDLLDQIAATRQHEKDEVAIAQAKEQEMDDRRSAAEQRELELKASTSKELDKMLEELKAVKAASASKPALVTGRSILRSRNLERVLAQKEHELKWDQAKLKHLQGEVSAKDAELEKVRKALLSVAHAQLPSASAHDAAAAKAALQKINGKLDAKEHELNATEAELGAAKDENNIQRKEIEVLKDDHAVLGSKVKKLSAALIKEIKEEKQLNEDIVELKKKAINAEHSRQEMESTNAELMKVAKAAREHAEEEVAAKANAAKAAADGAEEEEAGEETEREEQAQAQRQQEQEQEQKERQEQTRRQQQQQQQQQPQPQARASDDQEDDSEGDDDSDASDPSLVASVPWGSIEKVMAKNLRIVDKAQH